MEDENPGSHYLLVSAYFFAAIAYAVLIPDSWHLAEKLPVDSAAFSGALIGSYYASSLIGMISFHQLRKVGWTYKALFVRPCFGRVLSAFAFVLALQAPLALSPWLLVASRLTEGAMNACQFLCAIQFLYVTAKDRVSLLGLISLLANSGIGCGMLLSAAIDKADSFGPHAALSGSDFGPYATPVIFMGIFWAIFASVCALSMDQEDPVPREETSALVTKQPLVRSGNDLPGVRKAIILAAIFLQVGRGFVSSGIDSSSVLVLETQWGWPKASAAVAIGCCYLMSILWHGIFTFCRYSGVTDSILVHGGLALCTFATLGLFNVSEHEGANVALLLMADGLIFPVFMLTAGTVAAMSSRACLQDDDSLFGLPWVLFLTKACTETFGLGLGPVAARSMLDGFGRDYYAGMQLFCLISAAVAWAAIINPGYERLAANATAS